MVAIEHSKEVEAEVLLEIEEFFLRLQARSERYERKDGAFNTIEWALPALVAIWISKAFFDSFFKELGKNAAVSFSEVFSSVYKKLRSKPNRAYCSDDLYKIIEGASPDSVGHACPVLKIEFEFESPITKKNKSNCEFVFPQQLTDLEVQDALDTLATNLANISVRFAQVLDKIENTYCPLAFIYQPKQGWVSDMELIQKQLTATPKKRKSRKRARKKTKHKE